MEYEIPVAYDLYLDRLLEETYSNGVPEKLKLEIKRDLFGRLLNHIILSVHQNIPDEHAEAYDSLMTSNPSEEVIENFYQKYLPDYQEVLARALLEFRDIYKNG